MFLGFHSKHKAKGKKTFNRFLNNIIRLIVTKTDRLEKVDYP